LNSTLPLAALLSIRLALMLWAYKWAQKKQYPSLGWALSMCFSPPVTVLYMAFFTSDVSGGRGGTENHVTPLGIVGTFIAGIVLSTLSASVILTIMFWSLEGGSIADSDGFTEFLTSPISVLISRALLSGNLASLAFLRTAPTRSGFLYRVGFRGGNGQRMGRDISLALLGAAALVGTMFAVEPVQSAFGWEIDQSVPAPEGLRGTILMLTAVSLVAPLGEELFFRGYAFGMGRGTLANGRYGRGTKAVWAAALFSSTLFASAHLLGDLEIANLAPIFAGGMVFAFLYQKADNIFPCVVAHGISNAFALYLLI